MTLFKERISLLRGPSLRSGCLIFKIPQRESFRENNDYYLLHTYYVQVIMLNAIHASFYLTFTITL